MISCLNCMMEPFLFLALYYVGIAYDSLHADQVEKISLICHKQEANFITCLPTPIYKLVLWGSKRYFTPHKYIIIKY